jgi:spoIIIJ-associated protein
MSTEDRKNEIIEITKDLLDKVGFDGEVRFVESGSGGSKFATVSIESDSDLSMLIGKGGQNLHAFEHLVRLIAARKLASSASDFNFIVDVNDYRRSRTDYLVSMAKDAAQRVIQTRKAEALSPMGPYERKLIHTELASYKEVQTESVGQEPRRRVIIKPQLEQPSG